MNNKLLTYGVLRSKYLFKSTKIFVRTNLYFRELSSFEPLHNFNHAINNDRNPFINIIFLRYLQLSVRYGICRMQSLHWNQDQIVHLIRQIEVIVLFNQILPTRKSLYFYRFTFVLETGEEYRLFKTRNIINFAN